MAHRGRLTTAELESVFEKGETLNHRWFTLRVICLDDPAELGPAWGIAVGKRMAGSAVERNRLRRKVAAALRGVDRSMPGHIVVQLRREGGDISPERLRQAIEERLARYFRAKCTRG